jgi:hypothetical protein
MGNPKTNFQIRYTQILNPPYCSMFIVILFASTCFGHEFWPSSDSLPEYDQTLWSKHVGAERVNVNILQSVGITNLCI